MTYPISGDVGAVTSWGAAGFYNTLLSLISPNEATIEIAGDEIEVTPLNTAFGTAIAGLSQSSGTIRARVFTTPRLGNAGVVTYASGYVLHVVSYSVWFEAIVIPITQLATSVGSAPLFRAFMPGRVKWGGNFKAFVDNVTALKFPTPAGTAVASATFLYGDSAADETIVGTILTNRLRTSIAEGERQDADYSFAGSATPTSLTGTSAILGTSALGIPLWSQLGATTNTLLTLTAISGKTYTVDAFYKRIQLDVEVGSPVTVQVDWQGTGAVAGTGIS